MNPFSIKSYQGPEYFFDREQETRKLLDAIQNERNITLFSHRRLGKTMLIQHVFTQLDIKKFQPVYIDLFATRNLIHFTQKLTETLSELKIIKESKLYKILGSLGVSMTFDPLTGNPKLNFGLVDRTSINKSLPELFKNIKENKKHVVIALDECQELGNYEEDYAEASIRTLMQEFPDITYIFSGSRKSLMQEMFTNANRPFFQSTQMFELHEIERDIYATNIFDVLVKQHKDFDKEVIYRILDETYCHTGFTQFFLSRVYSESKTKIDTFLYEQVWSDILEENKSLAREQEFLLPALQWKTLIAIAREEFVTSPYSFEFIRKYDLSSPSSTMRAIKALIDKGLIIDSGDRGLRVYNIFIQKNLQKLLY
jgi:AAA+ ATPase superfamily predicted ATPase